MHRRQLILSGLTVGAAAGCVASPAMSSAAGRASGRTPSSAGPALGRPRLASLAVPLPASGPAPKVLAFDVFGTVVDWRTSIARESRTFLDQIGRSDIDAAGFADAWRFRYIGAMTAFRSSGRGFTPLDVLHREMLDDTLRANAVDPAGLDGAMLQDWTYAWRRLDPWPDAVEGLTRLKTVAPIVTLSNGNIALMLEMARRAGLPWDAILGAEVTRAYKPDPRAYLATAEILGVEPGELCLVAAHHSDLAAARASGLKTAYIARPDEYGGRRAPDADAAQDWEWSTDGLTELAARFGS